MIGRGEEKPAPKGVVPPDKEAGRSSTARQAGRSAARQAGGGWDEEDGHRGGR